MIREVAVRFVVAAMLPAFGSIALAEQAGAVGIEEKLGQTIPLGQLTFLDEAGAKVQLGGLFDRPIILTLVYLRCPGICTPLLNELARVADQASLTPGQDFRMIAVSFDPKETPDLAAVKRENMLAALPHKKPPADAWRFLTGDQENIARLADAVGFRYQLDKNQVDYVHPAVVIFLSADGKIVRYLQGMELNPADLEMAVADAQAGRPRSFIRNAQQVCTNPQSQPRGVLPIHTSILGLRIDYDLSVNWLILGVTLVVGLAFVIHALRQGRIRQRLIAEAARSAGTEQP